jgi:hypothetical protein
MSAPFAPRQAHDENIPVVKPPNPDPQTLNHKPQTPKCCVCSADRTRSPLVSLGIESNPLDDSTANPAPSQAFPGSFLDASIASADQTREDLQKKNLQDVLASRPLHATPRSGEQPQQPLNNATWQPSAGTAGRGGAERVLQPLPPQNAAPGSLSGASNGYYSPYIICMYVCIYVCMYVHTCYVLIKPPMPYITSSPLCLLRVFTS